MKADVYKKTTYYNSRKGKTMVTENRSLMAAGRGKEVTTN